MLPTTADGTPLCGDPRAAAASRTPGSSSGSTTPRSPRPTGSTRSRASRGEAWLPRYGGKISSEWFFSKSLQILDEAPDIYRAADRLIEAADWVVWQLTGVETRNSCTAGYKAIWSKADGFPGADYFGGARPALRAASSTRRCRATIAADRRSRRRASRRRPRLDGPAAPGRRSPWRTSTRTSRCRPSTVTGPGTHGRGHGHEHLPPRARATGRPSSRACAGSSRTGSCPACSASRRASRRSATSSRWFVDNAVPPARTTRQAAAAGIDVHALLEREAATARARARSGLLALDWWNGNRSILVDVDLSGLLVGATLATRAPDIYRALIEATAFGTRMIVDAFDDAGVAVERGRRLRRAARRGTGC